MKTSLRSTAQTIGLVLGLAAAMPIVWTETAPAASSENATTAQDSMKAPMANYDGFDRFRDTAGHPLPGWEFLFNSPG